MRKGGIVITTNGTYPWSFRNVIIYNYHSHDGDRQTIEVIT